MSGIETLPWSDYRSLADDYTQWDDGLEKLAKAISNSHGVSTGEQDLYRSARIRVDGDPHHQMRTTTSEPQSVLFPVKVEANTMGEFRHSLEAGLNSMSGIESGFVELQGSVPGHMNVIYDVAGLYR